MKRYFIAGKTLRGTAWMAEFIEAESFEHALALARQRAAQRFGGEPHHLTAVSELPELAESGPLALAVRLEGSAA